MGGKRPAGSTDAAGGKRPASSSEAARGQSQKRSGRGAGEGSASPLICTPGSTSSSENSTSSSGSSAGEPHPKRQNSKKQQQRATHPAAHDEVQSSEEESDAGAAHAQNGAGLHYLAQITPIGMAQLAAARTLFNCAPVRSHAKLSDETIQEVQQEVAVDPSATHAELLMYELALSRLVEAIGDEWVPAHGIRSKEKLFEVRERLRESLDRSARAAGAKASGGTESSHSASTGTSGPPGEKLPKPAKALSSADLEGAVSADVCRRLNASHQAGELDAVLAQSDVATGLKGLPQNARLDMQRVIRSNGKSDAEGTSDAQAAYLPESALTIRKRVVEEIRKKVISLTEGDITQSIRIPSTVASALAASVASAKHLVADYYKVAKIVRATHNSSSQEEALRQAAAIFIALERSALELMGAPADRGLDQISQRLNETNNSVGIAADGLKTWLINVVTTFDEAMRASRKHGEQLPSWQAAVQSFDRAWQFESYKSALGVAKAGRPQHRSNGRRQERSKASPQRRSPRLQAKEKADSPGSSSKSTASPSGVAKARVKRKRPMASIPSGAFPEKSALSKEAFTKVSTACKEKYPRVCMHFLLGKCARASTKTCSREHKVPQGFQAWAKEQGVTLGPMVKGVSSK